jgi:hypothetical protein
LHFDTVHSRHPDIEYHHLNGVLSDVREEQVRAVKRSHFKTIGSGSLCSKQNSIDRIVTVMTAKTQKAAELGQASPFAGALTKEEIAESRRSQRSSP